MAGLKEVRERISSVKSTQQITNAMKLVSASKLKRASTQITQMRPYADKLQEVMNNIVAGTDMSELSLEYNQKREVENLTIVLFTSDKGLCGGFNSNLIKTAKKLIDDTYSHLDPQDQITLIPIGKKGFDAFKNTNISIINDFVNLFSNLSFESTSKVSDYLINSFIQGDTDKIEVVYPQFKNAASQTFQSVAFLPIADFNIQKSDEEEKTSSVSEYIFEPNKVELLTELMPKILKTNFHKFALENNASEHGARMVAMDAATNNASELIRDLQIQYNKARQAAITNQIMEIVGGAAALEA